ncbi:MFS transporter [Maribacter polysaccharolyticus]|uniref:MFS transporter n=1 Tax=Maribacter polysaccharolyticus TaxID=3020831 RepID=UPI00237F4A01|nr:MFS transporter [Maribacter polysaccharolyticus]MDE3741757.1 MFS transporter [Maribacter polysaccharolyticus]
MSTSDKLSIKEKIGYALGDGAANIAWRGVATFLFIFYTDVFGLSPVTVGVLMLVARFSDGISDVLMGIIGDRTTSKYGKFRPWILWTAIPLAVILSLLFTSPDLGETGKIVYAYVTYIFFTLIYTANNVPYGALMAVMTGDDKERTSLGSYRMVGAFGGGMLVQGALLFLVAYYGNVDPTIAVAPLDDDKFKVVVSAPSDVENVNIKTDDGIANFTWDDTQNVIGDNTPTPGKSFSMQANQEYAFIVEGEQNLTADKLTIIDQKKGYGRAMYLMSVFLALFMFLTFYTTKERIQPPKAQENNLKKDFKDLVTNKPWLVLLAIGLLFNVYNSIKQGIVIIYFTHYLNDQLLGASFLIGLMIVSVLGAMATAPLGKKFGKRNLFIAALLFSGGVNALLFFCGPEDITAIFTIGILSEFAAAILPTLFFAMLGDAADYSEFKNGRRATGLIYSAGSFATKFGGGIAGAIIGMVLGAFQYNGQDVDAIQGAIPGIKMLMSWVPTVITVIAAGFMFLYPLTQKKLDAITLELQKRRLQERTHKQ